MRTWTKLVLCSALLLPAAARAQSAAKTTDTTETAAGKRTTDLADSGDRRFVDEAASGGLAEVQLGQLAAQRATSPEVKQFAQRMVEDHGKANDELQQIASKKSFDLPTEMDSRSKATYDELSKLSGSDFDKAYMDAMVKDHDQDVKAFKHEASRWGADPDVKAFARKTLNVLEEHDKLAHQDKNALKKK